MFAASAGSTSGSRRSPADTGEGCGKLHFWGPFIGFHVTFFVQHILGTGGMPRRYADYLPTDGFTLLNTISSVGAFLLGHLDRCAFLVERLPARTGFGEVVTADDPWGHGNSLGVGDLLPAAPAQLHQDAADPVGATRLRDALTRS